MTFLGDLIGAAEQGSVPEFLSAAADRVDAAYQAFSHERTGRYEQKAIYGVNTYTGHLAHGGAGTLEESQLEDLILSSHEIGGPPYFPSIAASYISLAKAYSIAAIGPVVSGETYRDLLEAIADPTFRPQIPMHASYSSGDVIPATHWMRGFLQWRRSRRRGPLKAGEAMGLVNGSFVHVGASAHCLAEVRNFWPVMVVSARESIRLVQVGSQALCSNDVTGPAWLRGALQAVFCGPFRTSDELQAPVSVRASEQVIEALGHQMVQTGVGTERALHRPSGNPLLVSDNGSVVPRQSGSFVDPALAIATSGLAEALLMAGWAAVQRLQHVASPRLLHSASAGGLQLQSFHVQLPKLAMAMLERCRARFGRRLFSSGGATSEGVEDFWTGGVETALAIVELAAEMKRIAAIEHFVASAVGRYLERRESDNSPLPAIDAMVMAVSRAAASLDSGIDPLGETLAPTAPRCAKW